MENGEVALPPENFKGESFLQRTAYRLWINRPWADWGSLSLSHILDRHHDLPMKEVWGVPNIMPKHQIALFVFTKDGQSYLTLCGDKATVSKGEAENFLKQFKHNFMQACGEWHAES